MFEVDVERFKLSGAIVPQVASLSTFLAVTWGKIIDTKALVTIVQEKQMRWDSLDGMTEMLSKRKPFSEIASLSARPGFGFDDLGLSDPGEDVAIRLVCNQGNLCKSAFTTCVVSLEGTGPEIELVAEDEKVKLALAQFNNNICDIDDKKAPVSLSLRLIGWDASKKMASKLDADTPQLIVVFNSLSTNRGHGAEC